MSDISCIYEPTLVLTIVHQCDVKQYFNSEGFNIHIIRLAAILEICLNLSLFYIYLCSYEFDFARVLTIAALCGMLIRNMWNVCCYGVSSFYPIFYYAYKRSKCTSI